MGVRAPLPGRPFSEKAAFAARLRIRAVIERLKVPEVTVASASGISVSSLRGLMNANMCPLRGHPLQIEAQVRAVMATLGATEDELATLFEAEQNVVKLPQRHRAMPQPRKAAAAAKPEEQDEVLSLKATLTPLAKKHFRVFVDPFTGPVSTQEQFFLGTEIAFVREAAWQCAKTAGMMAIVGESGAGKSTILEDLEERLVKDPQGVTVIRPSVVGMEPNDLRGKTVRSADLLAAIITKFEPDGVVPATLQARSTRAIKLLTASAQMGNQHLLLIDEAHCLPDSTLKHLKRLHELHLGRRPLLGILLLAQPELKRRLADGLRDGSLREVSQRCEVVDLLPLDKELQAYLECRSAAVGGDLAKMIDDTGIEQLRARLTARLEGRRTVSLVYPLAVGNLMVRAMNLCAELGVPLVTADVVKGI